MGKRWTYDPIISIYPSKLPSYLLRPVWTGVVDNNDLPVEIAIQRYTEANRKKRT